MMDNPKKQIPSRNDIREQSEPEKQIEEEQSVKPETKSMRPQDGILNSSLPVSKSRRESKIEKDELTKLFCDLVFMINGKVSQAISIAQSDKLPNLTASIGNAPAGNLKNLVLNKEKSRHARSKKQEQSKLLASSRLQQEPGHAISRKLSTQEQKLQTMKWEKQRKKQQILGNYSQRMKYILHEQPAEDQKGQVKVEADKKWNKDSSNNFELSAVTLNMPSTQSQRQFMKNQSSRGKDKHFSVFQQVSLMISPPIPH